MKWSNSVVVVLVIILCFGQPIKSSETESESEPEPDTRVVPRCHQPDILYSYLGDALTHYNKSYPYVDVESVLYPVLDLMLERGDCGISETNHDLMVFWILVCRAEDPDQEIEAWKVLAREIIHRLHTDESVYKISTRLFGDRMGGWLMKPRLNLDVGKLDALENCVHELAFHHITQCGPLHSYGFKYIMTFHGMCHFGLKGDEYADAAQQTCKDYVYISHPLREIS